MSNRSINQLFNVAMVLVFLLVGYIVFLTWFDFRAPPFVVGYSHPFALAKKATSRDDLVDAGPVSPGDIIFTYREICTTAPYKVLRIQRWLVPLDVKAEAIAFPILPPRLNRAIGCVNNSFSQEIPKETPPGHYNLTNEMTYFLDGNPITTFVHEWPPVRVTVK